MAKHERFVSTRSMQAPASASDPCLSSGRLLYMNSAVSAPSLPDPCSSPTSPPTRTSKTLRLQPLLQQPARKLTAVTHSKSTSSSSPRPLHLQLIAHNQPRTDSETAAKMSSTTSSSRDFSFFSLFTAGLACLVPFADAYTQPVGGSPEVGTRQMTSWDTFQSR